MKSNVVEMIKKDGKTEIKINGQPINMIEKYSISQDMNKHNGMLMLEIKMAIDEDKSAITIEDNNAIISKE